MTEYESEDGLFLLRVYEGEVAYPYERPSVDAEWGEPLDVYVSEENPNS